ncbi:MAG: SGNH/GDSL hydrolase family protein [Bryobacteraceae bacterium]
MTMTNRFLAVSIFPLMFCGFSAAAQTPCPVALQRAQKNLQDWPDLARYRAADKKLESVKAENRVVFLGDSITDGWGRRKGSVFFPGKPYLNRGISGQTTPQMLVRFQQDVVDLKPKVVVILAGTNDIAGNTGPSTNKQIEDNFKSMVAIAKQNHIKVVLASLTPARAYPWRPGVHPVQRILALNAWIKQEAAQNGLVFLDYFSAMAGSQDGMKPDLTVDGVHPNAKGYRVMAPLAEKAIRKALNQN